MTALRPELPPLPDRIARLPLSERGYPVPWFVAWINGVADFRVIAPGKREEAIRFNLCWICGERLGAFKAFLIGPMCAVNRVSSEPPCHRECAEFAAKACPFLVRPHAKRREDGLPEDVRAADGCGIPRNPGVALVWVVKKFTTFRDGKGGWLIKVGEPIEVSWFAEGRTATRAEVVASVTSGFPILLEAAKQDGALALADLEEKLACAEKLFPAEAA